MRFAFQVTLLGGFLLSSLPGRATAQDDLTELRGQALTAMQKAVNFYRTQVATHGGYVYHYDIDLKRRWGEGEATQQQIWVQPPGTPTVGLAYLAAFNATGDPAYLDAVHDVAQALMYGQLESGGWTNCIDFDPRGQRTALYRNGKGRGKNNSSLDDGQTQTAIRFMVGADGAFSFKNEAIHQSAMLALDSLLRAQFPVGGFPQVWVGPVEPHQPRQANYPQVDWRTEGRIKEYWNLYTLNDNVAVHVAHALRDAYEVYGDEKYLDALKRLGDFLILAQMPEPQPAWAQQYNPQMQPVWARRFEPPAISGHESQEVIALLMEIFTLTGDRKYLEPLPTAIEYLRRSTLPDGRLARYYELETNRPLYMKRDGDVYTLTYDDSNLPSHYGWKTGARVDRLQKMFNQLASQGPQPKRPLDPSSIASQVRRVISELDDQGRWISRATGQRLVGQTKFTKGEPYISSALFSRNLTLLADFIQATAP